MTRAGFAGDDVNHIGYRFRAANGRAAEFHGNQFVHGVSLPVMTTKKRVGVFPHAFIRVLALAGYGKRKLPRIFRWELVPMPIVIIQAARFIMAFG